MNEPGPDDAAPRADPTKSFDPDATLPPSPPGAAGAPPPVAIPGYEIQDVLGAGGMGVVYRAWHTKLGRTVAIKMMLTGARADDGERARFWGEAEAAAHLQHPGIVQVYEIGESDGAPFIALEFVDGGSLADRIRDNPQPFAWSARLIETLARAVSAAHQRGIIHRDLKPGNILLTADGTPKIADFGLAKRMDGPGHHTRSGVILGSLSYMSPEQAEGRSRAVGPPADVYALGAILYELLTGCPPFQSDNTIDAVCQIATTEPPRPRSLNPAAPRDLEIICLKALSKEPHRRYGSALEMAEDLERFQAGRPIRARTSTRVERAWRWCRRNPVVAGLSALAAVLLVAVLALALLRKPPGPADDSLKRVVAAGKLRFATDPTYPPMEFIKDGRPTGFDVELARRIASRLKVEAEIVPLDWDWKKITTRLEAGEFDALISTVTVTEDRRREVDFVEYWRVPLVFVCRQGVTVRTETDLAGKSVAVQADTTAQYLVEKLRNKGIALKQVTLVAGTTDPLEAIRQGKADVILVDEPVAKYYAKQDERLSVMGLIGHALDPAPVGIAFRKRDKQLQAAVADAVLAMRQDGTFAELLEEWFGQ